jgi:hypothetical protein
MIRLFRIIRCALWGHRGPVWLEGEWQNVARCPACCAAQAVSDGEMAS